MATFATDRAWVYYHCCGFLVPTLARKNDAGAPPACCCPFATFLWRGVNNVRRRRKPGHEPDDDLSGEDDGFYAHAALRAGGMCRFRHPSCLGSEKRH